MPIDPDVYLRSGLTPNTDVLLYSSAVGGGATVFVGALGTTASLPSPALGIGTALTVATVASVAAIPQAQPVTSSTLAPPTISTSATVGAPVTTISVTAHPLVLSTNTAVPGTVTVISVVVAPAALGTTARILAAQVTTFARRDISISAGQPITSYRASLASLLMAGDPTAATPSAYPLSAFLANLALNDTLASQPPVSVEAGDPITAKVAGNATSSFLANTPAPSRFVAGDPVTTLSVGYDEPGVVVGDPVHMVLTGAVIT